MARSRRRFPLMALLPAALLVFAAGASARAALSDSKPDTESNAATHYAAGMRLVEEGRHAAARVEFEKALRMDGEDPDILNMLAFTMRKTGQLEQAFPLYERALHKRERFPQAREYLGEAHLQAALLQIQLLRSYGEEGQEELSALLDALKRAANQAAGTDFEVEAANW